jgi:hypothetical protein
VLAQDYAAKKQYEQACALARRFTPPPSWPALPRGSREELQRRLTLDPSDFDAALALSRSAEETGDLPLARFIIAKTCDQPTAPAVLFYRQATLAEQAHDWEGAWRAWQRFHDKAATATH